MDFKGYMPFLPRNPRAWSLKISKKMIWKEKTLSKLSYRKRQGSCAIGYTGKPDYLEPFQDKPTRDDADSTV
jgi:hypothetical protein